jgi:alkanesulfonate monooxygenase SsuD/methylene tetrahydromethanopterin reductase-like flavin-dependent oxidoreductase (luciferase family)
VLGGSAHTEWSEPIAYDRRVKIGIQLPEVERPVTWSELREVALTAEDCGLDSIWVGDHLLYRDEAGMGKGPFEAWSTLAALAEATERVSLGPLVAATSFHAPAMLAKKAATVDDISGGRLILGLGAGWNRVEYEAFGFPHDRRVDRFEEAFTIIRTLIREGAIDHQGRYHTLEHCELVPRPRTDIPLMVGSNGPRMLRITAPHVDMWNTWHTDYENRPEGIGPLVDAVERAGREAGRDPGAIEKTAAVYVQMPRGTGREAGSDERPRVEPIVAHALPEMLEGFAEAGISHLQIVVDPIDATAVEELAGILGRV